MFNFDLESMVDEESLRKMRRSSVVACINHQLLNTLSHHTPLGIYTLSPYEIFVLSFKCWINSYFVYLFSCFISSWMCWKRMVPCPQRLSCTNTTSKMHKRQQFIDQWLYCYQRNAHLYSYVHTVLAAKTFKKSYVKT